MSAAPPPHPPTNGHVIPQINGYARSSGSDTMNSNRVSWTGSQGSTGGSSDGDRPIRPRYPHIKDLLAKAQAETSVNIHMPVSLADFLVRVLPYASGRLLGGSSANGSMSCVDSSPSWPGTRVCKAGQYQCLLQTAGPSLCRVHNQLRYHPASYTKAQRLPCTERGTWRMASNVSVSHQG